MQALFRQARVVLSGLILIAFFLPSYNGISGHQFIGIVVSEIRVNNDLTSADMFIVLLPLLLVPVSAFLIGFASWFGVSVRRTIIALPLLALFGFTCVFVLSAGSASAEVSPLAILFRMGIGFWLALFAAAGLPFTKNPARLKARRRRNAALEAA